MKKTLLVLFVAGYSFYASAQTLDLGIRGGISSTWLLNTNVLNAGSDQNLSSTMSSEFGFHSEINFLGGTGIELDVIYGKISQKYNGNFQDDWVLYQNTSSNSLADATNGYAKGESYTATTQITALKLPLLFHYQAKGGFIFEVGPEYAMLSGATYSATYSGNSTATHSSVSYGTQSLFASSSINAVLGFGWNIKLIPSGKLFLLASLRFEYGLTDIKGTDGLGQDLSSSSQSYQVGSTGPTTARYSSYAGTHMADGSFSIGVFYRLGLIPGGKSLL